jgi:phosphoribosylglycinamide formyltransferase-1
LTGKRCKTAILISGSGSNLQSFIDRVGDSDIEIVVVFSNRADAHGLIRAEKAGIDSVCIEQQDHIDREQYDRAVAAKLERWQPDLLILAGFMRILSPWFVRRYEGRILNIHPALLPAYPGLHTHERVIEAGDNWHGATVHFVTEELDGGPRVVQGRLATVAGESADALAARVLAIEHQIYPEAARWFAEQRLQFRDGNAWLEDELLTEPVRFEFDADGKRI